MADVALLGSQGSSDPIPALLDTGSPVSAIPWRDWWDAEYRLVRDSAVTIALAGSSVGVRLATVTLRLHDEESISPALQVKAYLLPDDSHPFLLGFEDFLTDVDLCSSFRQNSAYIGFPGVTSGWENGWTPAPDSRNER